MLTPVYLAQSIENLREKGEKPMEKARTFYLLYSRMKQKHFLQGHSPARRHADRALHNPYELIP